MANKFNYENFYRVAKGLDKAETAADTPAKADAAPATKAPEPMVPTTGSSSAPRDIITEGLMMDYQLTLTAILERNKRLFGRKKIVTKLANGYHEYTYADFYKRCAKLANALTKLGVKRGDRVGTFAWNTHHHLECYFAIPCMGAVVHTLNIRLNENQLGYIINHADDQVICVDADLLPLLEKVADQMTNVKAILVMAEPGEPLPKTSLKNVLPYEDILAHESDEFEWPDLDEREAAGMCYTSGTTGNPKGALYSHRSMYLHALSEATTANFAIAETDVVMPLVPMFHVMSWGMPFCSTMFGATQVYTGKYMTPKDLATIIQDHKVTFTAGVPTLWIGLLAELENGNYDISSLRRIPCGGSAAPRSLIQTYADDHDVEIAHAWGMTEMSPLGTAAYLRSYMQEWDQAAKLDILSKQGPPLPTVELRIVDDNGKEVAWDGSTPGELQARGPYVIREYYKSDRNAESFQDGWFRTGDVATIDEHGFVALVDRTKDLVKSGGEWISTIDLENALMAHPEVLEAAVIAIPHPKWQERPLALVVAKPGVTPEKESMYDVLRKSFQKWELPDDILLVEEIAKTSVGKFDKKVMRAQYKDFATK